ncbi:hypothetical protein AQPE_4740 [Aquipluma nitroreducens]|uniref:Uncharacterized protein n=1 Tax=Aquipluma nitroreducens TaxID=2010828 RepID=A0A5K7SGD8_9BACT|nr:hypothetical protein AQPE_4740 [Aquipluma nitroreducens]
MSKQEFISQSELTLKKLEVVILQGLAQKKYKISIATFST